MWNSLIFSLTLSLTLPTLGYSSDCLKTLSTLVKKQPKYYQAVIIYEDFHEHRNLINRVTKIISTDLPIWNIDSSVPYNHPYNDYPSPKIGRPRTFFILLFNNVDFAKSTLEKLESVLWSVHTQRILIVSTNDDFEEILKYAWQRQFIDVHYLLITESLERSFVYQYDPFSKNIETRRCTPKSKWYPEKIKNLHGQPLTIGILNKPPYSNVQRNSSGHVIKATGFEPEIIKYLEKALNFRINFLPWTGEEEFGVAQDNQKNIYNGQVNLTGFIGELQQRKMNLIANFVPRMFNTERENYFDYSRSINIQKFCPIVPVFPTKIFTFHQKSSLIVGFIMIVIFIIIAKFFKFDKKIWHFSNLVNIILGFSSTRQPRTSIERIFFITLISASSLYTVDLSNELLQNALNIKFETDFQDLNDAVNWPLIPMADVSVIPDNGVIEIKDRYGESKNISIIHWKSKTYCLEMLAQYKNVTCIMGQLSGRAKIFMYNSRSGKKIMKMTKKCLWNSMSNMLNVKGSPYTRYIDKKIENIRQSGIHVMHLKRDEWNLMVTTGNGDYEEKDEFASLKSFQPFIKMFLEVLVLAVSFVVAVLANLGIAACVLRYREMRTPTNLCLVNLAAADLLFALGVPAVAYTRLTQSWRLGEAVCRMLPYSQFVCGFVLLWTLTLISMDRHRCLAVAPYRSALTTRRVVAASFFTWIIAAAIFLPAVFWFKPMEIGNGMTICTLVFPRSDILNVSLCFTIPIIVVACILPMALLVYHYQRIFQRILDTRNRWAVSCVAQGLEPDPSRRRDSELSVVGTLVPWAGRKLSSASMTGGAGNAMIGRQARTGSLSQHEEIRLHKHLRVVRVLLLNVVAVLVMWLPITIVMLLIYLDGRRPTEDTGFFLRSHHFIWALVIAQFNTVVNPLLYGVFSENFRACFSKLWRRDAAGGQNITNNNAASGERGSGGGSKPSGSAGTKSLEALQCRLTVKSGTGGSFRNKNRPTKVSNCSIGSIIEVPASEKEVL